MILLVTGGLGFIGSNFILKMLDEDENLEIMNIDVEKNLRKYKNSLSTLTFY